MWEQYRKTFLGVQILAFGAAAWVYLGLAHWWGPAAIVFCTMQISAVFGAMWANRIKRRIEQSV